MNALSIQEMSQSDYILSLNFVVSLSQNIPEASEIRQSISGTNVFQKVLPHDFVGERIHRKYQKPLKIIEEFIHGALSWTQKLNAFNEINNIYSILTYSAEAMNNKEG